MQRHQPPDEWSFLRPDVLTDDDVLATLLAASEVAPEEAALHIDRSQRPRPALDPGRSEVTIDFDLGLRPITVRYFDDEEPERTGISRRLDERAEPHHGRAFDDDRRQDASVDGRTEEDPDGEPDLEEILESQHYAFAPEAPEVTATAPERDGTV